MQNGEMSFPRRILLAVTGLSPQVVTETLYALALEGGHERMPTEVHLLTTAQGAERARLTLLSDRPGWFRRLLDDYQLPPVVFDTEHIHVLRDASGAPLDDIRSPEDNLLCADFITEKVRELTADADSALHVSIAGGRKTMGFFLGYALSLFGRPQDKLSHVLVSEPFESTWEFFYPTPYSKVIETRDKSIADTRNAQVTLAEIPFVSLRHGLPDRLLDGRASFKEAVDAARVTVGPPVLHIDMTTCRVTAGGCSFQLSPSNLAMLALFARRAKNGEPPLNAPPKSSPDQAWADRFLHELRRSGRPLRDISKTEEALEKGMEGEFFSSRLSNLNSALKRALGGAAAVPYMIDDGGKRPGKYRLRLAPGAITISTSSPSSDVGQAAVMVHAAQPPVVSP